MLLDISIVSSEILLDLSSDHSFVTRSAKASASAASATCRDALMPCAFALAYKSPLKGPG